MPVIKAFLVCALATAAVLPANPAAAFCSKPIMPYCVEDGTLTDSYVPEDRCRRALQDHVEDLTRYRRCLSAEIEQIDAAVERFRTLLDGDKTQSRDLPGSTVRPALEPAAGVARHPA